MSKTEFDKMSAEVDYFFIQSALYLKEDWELGE